MAEEAKNLSGTGLHRVLEKRILTESAFIVRFERDGMQFIPGQHVIAGIKGTLDQREYSIYSPIDADYIEILVKTVPDGNVSVQLENCSEGDLLDINGPFGTFRLQGGNTNPGRHIFIATGTGISPFHCMVTSHQGIDYTILHGVRYRRETYGSEDFAVERYFPCISKELPAKYPGRVTDYLKNINDTPDTTYYICGNSRMIYDVTKILTAGKVTGDRILTEVYF